MDQIQSHYESYTTPFLKTFLPYLLYQFHGSVSNQIVKSLSLSHKKFYFFNMVQPIDLIFCKMVEIIEQNIFNGADFLFKS